MAFFILLFDKRKLQGLMGLFWLIVGVITPGCKLEVILNFCSVVVQWVLGEQRNFVFLQALNLFASLLELFERVFTLEESR